MSIHMQKQMDKIRRMILAFSADVERVLQRSIQAVETRDPELARKVIEYDNAIDEMEIDIEEECLHVLALEQPLAMDLRLIVAVLKMNNDLERIADIGVNIAQQAVLLSEKGWVDLTPFIPGMAQEVLGMLRGALDALLEMDVQKADRVRTADDRVDAMHRRTFDRVEEAIRAKPQNCSQYIHMLSISRNLERAADLATNIAEDVIYLARGEIQRHREKLVPARD